MLLKCKIEAEMSRVKGWWGVAKTTKCSYIISENWEIVVMPPYADVGIFPKKKLYKSYYRALL